MRKNSLCFTWRRWLQNPRYWEGLREWGPAIAWTLNIDWNKKTKKINLFPSKPFPHRVSTHWTKHVEDRNNAHVPEIIRFKNSGDLRDFVFYHVASSWLSWMKLSASFPPEDRLTKSFNLFYLDGAPGSDRRRRSNTQKDDKSKLF